MTDPTRRKMLSVGFGAAAGFAGLAAAKRLSERYGLIPPQSGGIYAPGDTLTYASQRLLTTHSLAREFPRDEISTPFPNTKPPQDAEFLRLQAEQFSGWQVTIDGMVAHPATLSLAELRSFPSATQITQLICEEGWSFVAEWSGVRLSQVLASVGVLPAARYVVYFSFQPDWWDSIAMDDALHPQTLLTYSMNSRDLPVPHGGPLRMRVPRQLGYKSVKFINRLIVTDDAKKYAPPGDYSWYAGI